MKSKGERAATDKAPLDTESRPALSLATFIRPSPTEAAQPVIGTTGPAPSDPPSFADWMAQAPDPKPAESESPPDSQTAQTPEVDSAASPEIEIERPKSKIPSIPFPELSERKPKPRQARTIPERVPAAKQIEAENAGRTPVITPELLAEIVAYIGFGNYTEIAVMAAGVNVQTHYWNMSHRTDYATAIIQARARAETMLVGKVVLGSPGHKGAEWLLERSRAKRWARREFFGLDERRIGELTDGELARLLPDAVRVLSDTGRDTEGPVYDITPEVPETDAEGVD